jgi:hypothetical protein
MIRYSSTKYTTITRRQQDESFSMPKNAHHTHSVTLQSPNDTKHRFEKEKNGLTGGRSLGKLIHGG